MESVKDVKQSIKKLTVKSSDEIHGRVLDKLLRMMDKSKKRNAVTRPNIWRIIIKSRITKFATAAVIMIVGCWIWSMLGEPGLTSITWADVRRASSQVETVHAVQSMIGQDGEEVVQGDFWFKRPSLFRQERRDETVLVIESSDKRLTIDRTHQRYQFSDPRSELIHALFNWLGFVQGEETLDHSLFGGLGGTPILEKIPAESTDDTMVYEVNSPTATLEKVWVHRATGLVKKLVWTEVNMSGGGSSNKIRVIRVKRGTTKYVWTFDYAPVRDEMFAMTAPEDYTEWYVPLSGKLVDQKGEPVEGAVVYAWHFGLLHKESDLTDQAGEWEIKLLPNSMEGTAPPRLAFPVFLWAFRTDDPNWVAWTVIEAPDNRRIPAGISLPGNLNELEILGEGRASSLAGAAGMTLEMEPAVKLFGRVTNDQGKPIAGADVRVRGWRLADENANRIYSFCAFRNYGPRGVKVDADGWYVLGNLPRLWPRSSIEVTATGNGYRAAILREEPLESKESNILLTKEVKKVIFPTVTITGKVKNDLGEPLVGYLVISGHDKTRTDKQGEFTLDCTGTEDLSLTLRGNRKFGDWDRLYGDEREFVYYPNKTHSIQYEPGKGEYYVEIVVEKPAIILEFVVKDTSNWPIQKALVSLNHIDISAWWNENFWNDTPTTDANGRCTVRNFPRVDKPTLVVHHMEEPYKMLNKPITLSENSKRYHIKVTLPKRNESIEPTVTITPVVEIE